MMRAIFRAAGLSRKVMRGMNCFTRRPLSETSEQEFDAFFKNLWKEKAPKNMLGSTEMLKYIPTSKDLTAIFKGLIEFVGERGNITKMGDLELEKFIDQFLMHRNVELTLKEDNESEERSVEVLNWMRAMYDGVEEGAGKETLKLHENVLASIEFADVIERVAARHELVELDKKLLEPIRENMKGKQELLNLVESAYRVDYLPLILAGEADGAVHDTLMNRVDEMTKSFHDMFKKLYDYSVGLSFYYNPEFLAARNRFKEMTGIEKREEVMKNLERMRHLSAKISDPRVSPFVTSKQKEEFKEYTAQMDEDLKAFGVNKYKMKKIMAQVHAMGYTNEQLQRMSEEEFNKMIKDLEVQLHAKEEMETVIMGEEGPPLKDGTDVLFTEVPEEED